jgi:uncharacterized protein YjbI with pentapeptide repeats
MSVVQSKSQLPAKSFGGLPESISGLDDYTFLRSCAMHIERETGRSAVNERTSRLLAAGRGLSLADKDLSGLDLSGFDLRGANLNRANLFGTKLDAAVLTGASLICAGTERASFRRANLRQTYLHAFSAQVCDFSEADLSDAVDVTGSLFHGCKLIKTTLRGSSLAGSTFYQCDVTDAIFDTAHLQGAHFNECYFKRTSFSGANLAQAIFTKGTLADVNFAGACGRGLSMRRIAAASNINFSNSNFSGTTFDDIGFSNLVANRMVAPNSQWRAVSIMNGNFSLADLTQSTFIDVRAHSLVLDCAKLDGAALRRVIWPGVQAKHISAENLHGIECLMDGANLDDIRARCLVLRDCSLANASMRYAYLYRAMITGDPPKSMILCCADLTGANLIQAYVTADLSGATLNGANLVYSRLNQSVLAGSALRGCSAYHASMIKVDFSNADIKGLGLPFFADRCPGLRTTAKAQLDEAEAKRLEKFLDQLSDVLGGHNGTST